MTKVFLVICLSLAAFVTIAHGADWDQKGVTEALEKTKAGKGVDLYKTYPSDQVNVVYIGLSQSFYYMIDMKAKLCFLRASSSGNGGITMVPCKSIKDGYPLIAPIIDWEK